ncbi:MAG TPA: hypothetical protein VFO17_00750 [Acidimicrobiia bacterium]|jgi:hypothetical protein|nr:hypothetical protein [Acidimicrobiia bacterium]
MPRALLLTLMLVTACSSGTTTTTTARPEVACQTPPAAETETISDLGLVVDPDPVHPREEATLLVPPDGLPADALSGVDAAWQCWDGSTWVTTHIVYRGVEGLAGQTIPVNSEFQIRVPSIGLPLGVAYPIVIPDVDPGIYRIGDDVILDAGPVSGFVVVEVTGD